MLLASDTRVLGRRNITGFKQRQMQSSAHYRKSLKDLNVTHEKLVAFQEASEGTAMKCGLGTSPKSFFIILSPCYQVQHGGYN